MLNFLQPLSHVVVKFYLDGSVYDVTKFKIGFSQALDYKGQPQHEVKGGIISLTIDAVVDDCILNWAKTSTQLKSGTVKFETLMSSPVMKVDFTDGYCINFTRVIDAQRGGRITLVISAETVVVNEVEHYNKWPK